MKPILSKYQGLARILIATTLILGITLRFIVFLQNRSLIIDEANLARNIVEKDYSEFLQPLDYEQYSPPIFSALSKASTQILGVNEFALKYPSLLAGCISLLLLFNIGKKLFNNRLALGYIIALWAFSELAIRYSSEFKQYSIDTAVCLFFTLWAWNINDKKNKGLHLSLMALAGSVFLWMSMPLIFILASIGLVLLYQSLRFQTYNLAHIMGVGAAWLSSFGIYYFAIIDSDAHSDYLQNYHQLYFFNFFPTSAAELTQSSDLWIGIFRHITDQTFLSIAWSVFAFLAGVYFIIKKDKTAASLLLLPILFCLIASHLKLYSLLPRLILFLIPFILLLIGVGFTNLWNRAHVGLKILMIIPVIVSVLNSGGFQYFNKNLEIEDSKGVMTYLKKNRLSDEWIYVQYQGAPAFYFYNTLHEDPYNFKNYHLAQWREDPEITIRKNTLQTNESFWLFFSHTYPQEKVDSYKNIAARLATKTDEYQSIEASTSKWKPVTLNSD